MSVPAGASCESITMFWPVSPSKFTLSSVELASDDLPIAFGGRKLSLSRGERSLRSRNLVLSFSQSEIGLLEIEVHAFHLCLQGLLLFLLLLLLLD